ncbi:MAG: alpha-2-macroglobulin family protein, partial [Chloroflexota bacterium]
MTIRLPDNLTTWRLDARGVSADTLVGQNTVDIVATKDLLVRPVTPRFFVVGDQAELAAVINNNTDSDLSVDVTLSGSGFTLADPAVQTIMVKADDRAQVQWTATITDAPTADLTFTAVSGSLTDASKPPLGAPPDQLLPIYKYSAPETAGTAGELDGSVSITELIALPRRFDASQGQLSVELSPSLAAGMTAGLDYLEHYPYECTEQTISRFLPNVLTYTALKKLGVNDPALETRLTSLVNAGAQKLYAKQHADGGWGWWTTDQSDAFITAYVLFGLNKAKEAGFAVTESALNSGAEFLKTQMAAPNQIDSTWQLNRQAFMLYALADSGYLVHSDVAQMYEARARLDTYAKAYLALAFGELDPQDSRLKTLLSDINNAAILSATGAHWEESGRDFWNMNTDTRSTAIVLSALATLDPENNLNPGVVRWLMTARKASGGWETTQETAWALIGLTDWMSATGELKANYTYTVSLNGAELSSGAANADNLRDPVSLQVAVADLVKEQANRLVFNRAAGDGRLYYTAHLTVYQNVKDVKAQNKGVIVARQYTIPNGDCGGREQPKCPPVTSAQVGDDIKVTVTVIAPNDLYYVRVEDPIPAGTEPVDTSLLTTSVVGQSPELNPVDPLYYGWGWWWFSNTDIR